MDEMKVGDKWGGVNTRRHVHSWLFLDFTRASEPITDVL